MPTFKLSTGLLPQAIKDTVSMCPGGKEDFSKLPTLPKDSNNRRVYMSYKVKEEDKKSNKVLPMSFAVEVPVIDLLALLGIEQDTEMYEAEASFVLGLVQDYQNKVIKDSADSKTKINPLDLDAIVKDYLSTDRTRDQPTVEQVEVWARDVWAVSYQMRVIQLNELAPKEGRTIQKDEQTNLMISKYREFIRAIGKATCTLSVINIKGVRQNVERLIELGLLEADDEVASFIVERAKQHVAEWDKQQAETTVADVG